MTQTLTTTEELKHLASSDNTNGLTRSLARECLAYREAQPIYQIWDDGRWYDADEHIWRETYDEFCESQFRVVYTAPPAPAVPNEMPDAAYAVLSKACGDNACLFADELWSACRAAILAAAPEGGNG